MASETSAVPPVSASLNAPPAAEAAAPAPQPAAAPAASANTSNTARKGMALAASILTQTGSGFGVGALLAQGNAAGASLLIAIASFIFVIDVYMRYAKDKNLSWILIGTILLSALALIPYNVMKSKGKGKTQAAAIPTMAAVWTVGALVFGAATAGWAAGPMQGVLISIMYMALSSLAGYNMQNKAPGTAVFAGCLWALLLLFDILGFRKATAA